MKMGSFTLKSMPFILVSFLVAGCGSPSSESQDFSKFQSAVTTKSMTPAAVAKWNAYVATVPTDVQAQCKPVHFPAKNPSASRGTVILFHGFTACSQQFFELGRMLSEQSFDVLIPTLPGHGRIRSNGRDISSEIPGATDWQKYVTFTDQMNSIMESTTGIRGTSGISVGSSIAALAAVKKPSLYERALIVTPHFENSNALLSLVARSLNVNSVDLRGIAGISGERDFGWGEGCERELAQGRAGICNFKIKHFAGIVKFGDHVRSTLKKVNSQLQFVGVENDAVINNSIFDQGMGRMWTTGKTQACFFPAGANHSLYSRFDSPWENKFWISTVHRASTDFFTSGRWFTQSHVPSRVGNHRQCALDR